MKNPDSKRPRNEAQPRRPLPAGDAPARLKSAITLILLTLAVSFAVFLVHRPVLSAWAASFDDEEAIIRNQLVQHPSANSVERFFKEVLLSSVVRGYYRPLTLTSLMLDWAMGGRPDNFYAFHRTSLALHIGSTVLVILLCYQLFGNPWIASAVGLLFGVHPLTVEPIAWVMERKTVLAAFFAFAAINAYVRFTRTHTVRWYAAALVMFLAALLSKPTATPLPLIMLLMDYWPLKRLRYADQALRGVDEALGETGKALCGAGKALCGTGQALGETGQALCGTGFQPVRPVLLEKIPFIALSAVFAILACVCEQKVNPLTLPAAISPLHLPLRLCWLTVFYPCKILLPINLSSVYMLPDPLAWTNPIVIAAAAGAILLIAAVVLSARRTPAIWVGTAIFYLGLAPTMGFVGYSWVAASDKYVYLPAIGVVLVLAWAMERLCRGGTEATRRTRQAAIAAIVLIAAALLSVGTRGYLDRWQTTEGFLAYMLHLAPRSHHLHCQMGAYHLEREEYEASAREYTTAIGLHATNPDALVNRGIAFHGLGRDKEALVDYAKAIQLRPNDAESYYNRAMTLAATGAHKEAIRDYDEAIRLKPDYVSAYNNRGVAYTTIGLHERALQDHNTAIGLDSGSVILYNNRAVDYYQLKQYDKAWADIEHCRKLGGTPTPQLVALLRRATGRQQ